MAITQEDKRAIDEAVKELHYVAHDENGQAYIEIYADYRETNEGLLKPAYENRRLGFDDKDNPDYALIDMLHGTIDGWYTDEVARMENEILEKAGFDYLDDKADELLEYMRETYPIQPDYDHFMKEEVPINIMLGLPEERSRDFGTIRDQISVLLNKDLTPTEREASLEEETGLRWLVMQQGHTMKELDETLQAYLEFWDSPEAEDLKYDQKYEKFKSTHDPFLTSVCQEVLNTSNYMNTMTVLTKMSLTDFAEFMKPGKEIVLPKDSMVGIFNPWNGGGSTLEIELQKELVVPSSLVYDIQVEGVKPDYQYTVDDVYGLVGSCWQSATAVRDAQPEITTPMLGMDNKQRYNPVFIDGQPYEVRLLTSDEWDKVIDTVGANNNLLHYSKTASWVQDNDDMFPSWAIVRGGKQARTKDSYSKTDRGPIVGFRPCLVPLNPSTLKPDNSRFSNVKDGELLSFGTVRIGAHATPYAVPKTRGSEGDIPHYYGGGVVSIYDSTDVGKRNIQWVKAGNLLVADRNLLLNVDWNQINDWGLVYGQGRNERTVQAPAKKPSLNSLIQSADERNSAQTGITGQSKDIKIGDQGRG